MADEPYAVLYLQGIEQFNACEFYDAHDLWEELWAEDQSPSRRFYQGLIQAAVALHHFGNGNVRGACKLYRSSGKYLEPYRPHHLGLDVDAFLRQMDACFAEAVACDEARPRVEIDPERIPEIHLDPPAAAQS